MTHTIWKYPLKVTDEQVIEIPLTGRVLCVQAQNDKPCLWVLWDQADKLLPKKVRIHMYGTGHPISEVHNYVGTFQMLNGGLVYHVFGEDVK